MGLFNLGKSAEDWWRLGNQILTAGDDRGAIEHYNRALKKDENFWAAYANRGAAEIGLKDYRSALNSLNAALRLNPNNTHTIANRAFARKELGDLQGALEDESRAITLNPIDPSYYNNRSITYRLLGRYQEAIRDCDNALLCRMDSGWKAKILNTRGRCYYMWGDFFAAIEDFDHSIGLYAEDETAFCWRGAAKLRLDRVGEAVTDYMDGFRLSKGKRSAHLHQALHALESQKFDLAVEALRKELANDDSLAPLVAHLEQAGR